MRFSDFSGSFDRSSEINQPRESQPRESQTDGMREAELAQQKEAPEKAVRERAEKEKAEGSERAGKSKEAQDRRLRHAAVKREFDSKLQERIARTYQVIEAIGELEGRDRGDSLAEIAEEISALDVLLAEQAEAKRRAGGQLLQGDEADQIARFDADAENLAGDLRRTERVLWREERIEDGHIRRVPGLLDLDLAAMSRTIVTKVAHVVAVVIANHVAAGPGELLARTGEWVMKACDAPERLDNAKGLKVKVPLPIDGLLNLDIETTLSDDITPDEKPPLVLGIDLSLGGEPASYPQVELVEEDAPEDNPTDDSGEPVDTIPAREVSVSAGLGWPGITQWPERGKSTGLAGEVAPGYELAASLQATPQTSAPAPEGTAPEGTGCPEGTLCPGTQRPDLPLATGIVLWGSAKTIALGTRTRILGADILLSCGREAAFEKVYDGTAESVAHAMRAARGLEVVVFLDPDIQGGLWIDIDPVTQAPAATLLIDMPVSADGVQGFRLLQSPGSHAA